LQHTILVTNILDPPTPTASAHFQTCWRAPSKHIYYCAHVIVVYNLSNKLSINVQPAK